MKKNHLNTFNILLSIILLTALLSCDNENVDANLLLTEGIIIYMAPPDNRNSYIIKTGNFNYQPADMSSDFKIDSLSIRFAYDETENRHNCGFGGTIPIIELTHIEKR